MEIQGRIVAGESMEVVEGTVVVRDGRIAEVREEGVDSDRVVVPALVNAHTHIGDSVAKETGRGLPLDEVVAPPDSHKHRILRSTSREEKRAAMRRTVERMRSEGVGVFGDFREGGVEGAEDIRAATEDSPVRAFVLGSGPSEVLDIADGYGASGARDDEFWEAREEARERGKPFGIHAGERDPDDIDGAFEYEPGFLVHMVHARDEDLDRLAETDTPVVACPRCNLVIGVGKPPVEELVEATTVALGTDNVMLNVPSVWREMEFVSKHFDVPDDEVLRMATVNGARALDVEGGIIEEGEPARLVVLRGDRSLADVRDVVAGVVRRVGAGDVERVVLPDDTRSADASQ
jgi:cytosine/adenosine deaminase-related metal-dependent hydrolase